MDQYSVIIRDSPDLFQAEQRLAELCRAKDQEIDRLNGLIGMYQDHLQLEQIVEAKLRLEIKKLNKYLNPKREH